MAREIIEDLDSCSSQLVSQVRRLIDPYRSLASPVFLGLDRIPDERPLLFVGNHTLYGLLDVPFLLMELYERKGIFLRALGDHEHFKIPIWRDLLEGFGAVDGTRENCSTLMRAGQAVLVFPGGAKEVFTRNGEKYKLLWRERLGFARMAVAHGCTIVPFAAVGVEDALDNVLDANDMLNSRFASVLRTLGVQDDWMTPIVKGIGPTPLPRPERLYYYIGEPIHTSAFAGQDDNPELCRRVRDQTRGAIESGRAFLKEYRSMDPERSVRLRLAKAAVRAMTQTRAFALEDQGLRRVVGV